MPSLSVRRAKEISGQLQKTIQETDRIYNNRRLEAIYCHRIDQKLVCTKPEMMAKELVKSWVAENLEDVMAADAKKVKAFGGGQRSSSGGKSWKQLERHDPPPSPIDIGILPHVAEIEKMLETQAKARAEQNAQLDQQFAFWGNYLANADTEIAKTLTVIKQNQEGKQKELAAEPKPTDEKLIKSRSKQVGDRPLEQDAEPKLDEPAVKPPFSDKDKPKGKPKQRESDQPEEEPRKSDKPGRKQRKSEPKSKSSKSKPADVKLVSIESVELSEEPKTGDSEMAKSELYEPEIKQPKSEPEIGQPKSEPEIQQSESKPEIEQPKSEPEIKQPESEPEVGQPKSEPEIKQPESEPEVGQPESKPEIEQPESEPGIKQPESEPVNVKPMMIKPELVVSAVDASKLDEPTASGDEMMKHEFQSLDPVFDQKLAVSPVPNGDLELSLNVDLNNSDQQLDKTESSAGSVSPESKKKGKKGGKKGASPTAAAPVPEQLESPKKKGNKYAHLSRKKKH